MQKVCHSREGGGGSGKKMTKCDMGGRGVKRKSDVTHHKIQSNQFSFLQFSILKSLQSFLRINPFWPSKFLKSFLTRYLLVDSIAFERSVISFYYTLVTKSPISPQYIIQHRQFLFIFSVKVCHFLVSDIGGGGQEKWWQSVTWGEGGGSKMTLFRVTYFLHGP